MSRTLQAVRRRKTSVKLFVSYSHRNRVWMERLSVFLNGFQYDARLANRRLHYVHAWHDNELAIGNPWDDLIKQELDAMDIFVPLVSPDFFASWYIQEVELKRAESRFSDGAILIVPIMIYELNLRDKCPFLHGFSRLPATDKCWKGYRDPNDAYRLIDDGLWRAIDEVLKRRVS